MYSKVKLTYSKQQWVDGRTAFIGHFDIIGRIFAVSTCIPKGLATVRHRSSVCQILRSGKLINDFHFFQNDDNRSMHDSRVGPPKKIIHVY